MTVRHAVANNYRPELHNPFYIHICITGRPFEVCMALMATQHTHSFTMFAAAFEPAVLRTCYLGMATKASHVGQIHFCGN